jgi:hypothetical protein
MAKSPANSRIRSRIHSLRPGVRNDATEEGPPDASGEAVIDADRIFNDDLAPGRMWASVTLMKQRRAFMTEIMSTTTVLVKSIKSTCRVKFPTEKDHTRGAISILLVSRGSRGSWVSGPLGVRTSGCLDLRGCLDLCTSWMSGPLVGVWTSSWVSGPLWTSEDHGVWTSSWVSGPLRFNKGLSLSIK